MMGWPEAFSIVGVAWAIAYVCTHINISFK